MSAMRPYMSQSKKQVNVASGSAQSSQQKIGMIGRYLLEPELKTGQFTLQVSSASLDSQYKNMKMGGSGSGTPNKKFGYESQIRTASGIPISVIKENGTGGALRTAQRV